ncbi:efflux RND transporter periplasmic adaptor subunit [Mesorhizobium sp. L-8-3]|uniref:efflux RND transporter periplasmic adaptor subunit n=1 Tax=Mesorhizobium sp. L-8-3 TaxID=2744522 RepID=UPI0019283BF0|nr:efflux RND transporter periplasmic adaptor subunit [Mesorhizobium sp. L-8-3]BCH23024.1 hemolysin secretion protein D [Mesorhizobium sp. L-8-3]
MSVWKQIAFSLVLLAAAALAWLKFFPGADEVLARWGIDWAIAATQNTAKPAGDNGGQRGGGAAPNVVTAPVVVARINDRLQAIGTGRARASVTVNPFTSGRLTEIAVTAGTLVRAGDVIARLDSNAEEIVLDRAKIALDDAQAKLVRMKTLRTSNTATAVQLADAEVAQRNAELAVRDAELALERRSVEAPISGIVGILPVEVGNYVTTQTPIATIDDRSTIQVDFWVPERYVTAIKVGAPVTASPIARPSVVIEGTVAAVDSRLDEASRTLLVRADLPNPDDTLRAGMSFQVAMRFPGDEYPSVSPLSIQWGSDGAFIWTIEDGRARRVPVRIVQRNSESVLVEAPIRAGDIIVTEGVQNVREGSEVMVADRRAPGAQAESAPTPTGG